MLLICPLFLSSCLFGFDFNLANTIYDDDEKIIKANEYSVLTEKLIGVNLEFESFVRVHRIFDISADSNESCITIELNSELEKGSFKCVLVTPDDQIINILEHLRHAFCFICQVFLKKIT